MPGYDETQNLIGNDPFQRLMRAKYERERMGQERDMAAMRYGLPGVGGSAEPAGAGISWFNPQNRGQIRDFEGEREHNAAFIAKYGMSPADIMEGYRVNNLMPEQSGGAPGAINPLSEVVDRVNAAPANYVMASSRNSAPPAAELGAVADKAGTGSGLNLRPAALGREQAAFAGFKSGLADISTPDTLAGGYDVGQRYDKAGKLITGSTASPVNITAGQKAKGEALKRMTAAPVALTEAKTETEKAKAAALTAKATVGAGPAKPTEAQKAVDRAFGKDYAAYIAGGGYSRTITQLDTLKNANSRLQSGKENLSGPILSMAPERARMKSIAVQQEIEKTIQSSLRETLGAQFTEKEGENLMKRSFDPRLNEKENAKRVGAIIRELEMMAKAKKDAADYYQKNGSLVGYKGKMYTIKNGEMVEMDAPASSMPNSDPMGLGI